MSDAGATEVLTKTITVSTLALEQSEKLCQEHSPFR